MKCERKMVKVTDFQGWFCQIYVEVVTMTQALPKLVTFEEFTAWRPEGVRYELHDGVIVDMSQPVGGQLSYNIAFLFLSLLPKDGINILLAMNNPYNIDTVIIATKINTPLFVGKNS
jgi:Putative restriction endonuclease